jgi:hypothetical protein
LPALGRLCDPGTRASDVAPGNTIRMDRLGLTTRRHTLSG